MAKPIKSTPELVGKEADRFLEEMIKVERAKITQKQKEFSKQIEKNMEIISIC